MAPALPPGSTILVTGANGFLGSHITDQLLASGYAVRATVRSSDKGELLKSAMEKRQPGQKLSYEVVANASDNPEQWDALLADCAGVVHVASDVSMNPDPNVIIPPTVAALRAILAAAKRVGSIQRFVYTSSSTAIGLPKHDVDYSIDENTWNEESTREAWAEPHAPEKAYVVYGASKAEAEKAAWQFVAEEKPGFVFNTVCPETLFGEIILPPGSTSSLLRSFYQDPSDQSNFIFYVPPQHGLNVTDAARLHVGALLHEEVKEKRLLGFAWPWNLNTMVETIKKIEPTKEFPELPKFPTCRKVVHQDTSLEVLKRMGQDGFIPKEQTVRETISSQA
jgi:nucleoside-diphosphate-sugar epimerase